MTKKERIDWLLGEELPVRTIPAGYVATREHNGERPLAPVDPDAHKVLGEIEEVDENHHAWIEVAHIDGVHNTTRLHVDDKQQSHYIVVSSANRAALDEHLKSASIWLRATPSSPATGPLPINLQEVLAKAVLEETGSSVETYLSEPRQEQHVHYHDLLGTTLVAAVRDRAVRNLDEGLQKLESANVIDGDDRATLDSGKLIDHFLNVRVEDRKKASAFEHDHGYAARLQAHPGSVLTRIGPVDDDHDLFFNVRDIGSVPSGDWKIYTFKKKFDSVKNFDSVEVKVTLIGNGDVKAQIWGGASDGVLKKGANSMGKIKWSVKGENESVDTGGVQCEGTPPLEWILGLWGNKTSSVEVTGNAWNFIDK